MNRKLKTFFSIFFSVTLISALITSCANAGGSGGYTDPYAGLSFNKENTIYILYDMYQQAAVDNANKKINEKILKLSSENTSGGDQND